MEFDSIRPFVSGTLGGLLTLFLLRKWAKYVPRKYGAKDAEALVAEYRTRILVANALFFGLIVVGIYLFRPGRIDMLGRNPLALVCGAVLSVPAMAIILPGLVTGRTRIVEAFVAYALAQRTPVPVLAAITVFGALCLVFGIWGFACAFWPD